MRMGRDVSKYVPVFGSRLMCKTDLARLYGVSQSTLRKWLQYTELPVTNTASGEPFEVGDVLKIHFCWVAFQLFNIRYATYKQRVVYEGQASKFHLVFRDMYGGGDLRQALIDRLDSLNEGQRTVARQLIDYLNYLEEEDEESGTGSGSIGDVGCRPYATV